MNPWSDSPDFAREAAKVESAGEALMLTLLWWRRAGWTVVTQKPIEQYRIDLFVPEAGVAIEVDSFAGHGSNAAMERDAKKRNLVVAKGWAPLAFSAQQAMFHSHDTLAAILSTIEGRLPLAKRPGPAPSSLPSEAPMGLEELARRGREFIASLYVGPDDPALVLSPTHRAMGGRTHREMLGVELLGLALKHPALLKNDAITEAMASIDGPVALAASRLRETCVGGRINRTAFLDLVPAILRPVAEERIDGPAGDFRVAARHANDIVARLGSAA